MRFMIIDDEIISRKKILETLQPYGTCNEFDNGNSPFEFCKQAHIEKQRIDLITLDLYMPQINGIEVLANLRSIEDMFGIAQNQQSKIIIISSSEDKYKITEAIYAGCDDFIQKPFDKSKLISNISQLKQNL